MTRTTPGKATAVNTAPATFFKTVAGPGATAYPSDGAHGSVYYAEEQKNPSFEETVAATGLTTEDTGRFAFVFVSDGRYVLEGTVLLCEPVGGRWITP